MAIARRNSTYALVTFYKHDRQGGEQIDTFDATALETGGLLNTSLVAFTHDKRLGGTAAGAVSITLKGHQTAGIHAGEPWTNLIANGDWWAIDIVKNGTRQGLSFGVIDTVGLAITAGAHGVGEVVVTVTGRDFGFALDDTPVYFNPFDPTIDNALGMNMLAILAKVSGAPHEVLVSMLKGMMGGLAVDPGLLGGHTKVPSKLSGGAPDSTFWIDHLDTTTVVQPNLRGECFAAGAITPQGASSVWDFLGSWRNPSMNELFIDPKPEPGLPKKALLVLREKPFVNAAGGSTSPWFALRAWNVEASSIESLNLSRGANRINHITLTGDIMPGIGNDAYGIYRPVADRESIDQFGLRKLEEQTRYFDNTGESGFISDVKDWLFLIVSWNVLNHEYWQGSINIGELRAEIRIGQKVSIMDGPPANYQGLPVGGAAARPRGWWFDVDPKALTFYVEGVSHSYTEGSNPVCSTSLLVSQGYQEGLRLSAITERVAKFRVPTGTGSANEGELNVQTVEEDKAIDAGSQGGAEGTDDYEIAAEDEI